VVEEFEFANERLQNIDNLYKEELSKNIKQEVKIINLTEENEKLEAEVNKSERK
jgi:hypothetical protein